jgi:hypothetical protein
MQTLRKTFRGLPLVAGHLVLDFVNTVEYRGRKRTAGPAHGFFRSNRVVLGCGTLEP